MGKTILRIVLSLFIVCAIAYAYKLGQRDTYDKMMKVAGGQRGDRLIVASITRKPIHRRKQIHPASICSTCHVELWSNT